MALGSVALVLHAHLPFVRHPELPESLEERWLFEAVTETYLPLLDVLDGLARDRVSARCTVSLSPTLLAMFGDGLLRARYRRHLDALLQLSEREARRTRDQPAWRRCAELYVARLTRARARYLSHWGEDLAGAFRGFAEQRQVELATTSATHAVLPLLAATPAFARAQIAIGVAEHRRWFGMSPAGFWLPECAFEPGLDAELARAGVRWCILDTHGVVHATPQPVYGVYAPIACPSGVLVYGRDPDSATQVWSAEAGYPADPWYRDFHRDIGFDLPPSQLGPFGRDASRTPTGLKYHRITGDTPDKEPYDPARAQERVAVHAAHFVASRRDQVARLAAVMDRPPVVVCPYDAELFGHWWFEGPDWLDAVLRGLAAAPELEAVGLSQDLDRHPVAQRAVPAASTWGWRGHHGVWLQRTNDWIYPRLHRAAGTLLDLCHATPRPEGWRRRALTQALRELLLAQASDWAFMMARGTTVEYAGDRTLAHLDRCTRLCDAVATNTRADALLAASEDQATVFPELALDVIG
jgi:1,4-alpha-glucan branching enzyme